MHIHMNKLDIEHAVELHTYISVLFGCKGQNGFLMNYMCVHETMSQ